MGGKSPGPLSSQSCNQLFEAELVTGCVGGIHEGFTVGIILLNIFIHDLGCGMECTLSRLGGSMTLEEQLLSWEDRAAVQRDLDALENDLTEIHEVQQGQMRSGILHLRENQRVVLAEV